MRRIRTDLLLSMAILGVGVVVGATAARAERVVLEQLDEQGVTVAIAPDSLGAGHAEVALHFFDGEPLATTEVDHDGSIFRVRLAADLAGFEPADLYLRWFLEEDVGQQRRSLLLLQSGLKADLFRPSRLIADERGLVVVQVREYLGEAPVAAARCHLEVVQDSRVLARATATSDEDGIARLAIDIPAGAAGRCDFSFWAEHGSRRVSGTESVVIRRGDRVLLTTDRPLYQPGQTIQARALCLHGPQLEPVAGDTAIFVYRGPHLNRRVNVVRRDTLVTDAWGVASSDLVLGDPVPEGTYDISLLLGGRSVSGATVTVKRYVLPRWRLVIVPAEQILAPGDTLTVRIRAAYHFGEPVPGGEVRLDCRLLGEGRGWWQQVRGELDADGRAEIRLELPPDLILLRDKDRAQLRLEATVTDSGGYSQTQPTQVVLTEHPLRLLAAADGGGLEAGLDNTVHLVLSDALQRPVTGRIRNLNAIGPAITVTTDSGGQAQLNLAPHEVPVDGRFEFLVEDDQGRHARLRVKVGSPEAVGMRLTCGATAQGDVRFDVATSAREGLLMAFLTQAGQLLDQQVLGRPGRGRRHGRLGGGLSITGEATVEVRWMRPGGAVHTRQRTVIFVPENHLEIGMSTDRPVYAPGDTARIRLDVRDDSGRGVAAVVGFDAVDNAVFDLARDPSPDPGTLALWLPVRQFLGAGDLLDDPDAFHRSLRRRRGPAYQSLDWLMQQLATRRSSIRHNPLSCTLTMESYENRHAALLWEAYKHVDQSVARLAQRWSTLDLGVFPCRLPVAMLVLAADLDRRWTRDPWGQSYRLRIGARHDGEVFCTGLYSAGIDGRWSTGDDLVLESGFVVFMSRDEVGGIGRAERLGDRWYWYYEEDGETPESSEIEWLESFDITAVRYMAEVKNAVSTRNVGAEIFERYAIDSMEDGGDRSGRPRLREDFRETACWEPRVITDRHGRAEIELPLPDALTRWRLRGLASDRHGNLGDLRQWLDTKLDFFVDVAQPEALTQGDRIALPVMVHNGLGEQQTVRLELSASGGIELAAGAETRVSLTLGPGEARAVPLPLIAVRPGMHTVTVVAHGELASDAVRREIRVRPDGRPERVVHAGVLVDRVRCDLAQPADTLPGTGTVTLTVTPDLVAEVTDALVRLRGLPVGCFEQTTSLLRLQALALDLQRRVAGTAAGARAAGHRRAIARGLQSLPWFECAGGGFGWFGSGRPDRIMSATALWTLHELQPWGDVDPDLIGRTLDHLEASQWPDGSWIVRRRREGEDPATDRERLRCTALVAWALAETDHGGTMLDRALAYLAAHVDAAVDSPTLASVLLAHVQARPDDPLVTRLADLLAGRGRATDAGVVWAAGIGTLFRGRGLAGDRETTALVVRALLLAGRHEDRARQGLAWLATARGWYGLWGSTQATLQSLRAFALANGDDPRPARGRLEVLQDGVLREAVDLKHDVFALHLDLADTPGDCRLELRWRGEGRPFWKLDHTVYRPWAVTASTTDSPLIRARAFVDRDHVAVGDMVNLQVRVAWRGAGYLFMPMVELALPPGTVLLTDALESQRERGVVSRWEQSGGRLLLYLNWLTADEERTFTVPLVARWAGQVRAGAAHVWAYYDPDTQVRSRPALLEIEPAVRKAPAPHGS